MRGAHLAEWSAQRAVQSVRDAHRLTRGSEHAGCRRLPCEMQQGGALQAMAQHGRRHMATGSEVGRRVG